VASWKDKLKAGAQQGRSMVEQAKTTVADQQAKRTAAWAEDPATLWMGESKGAATSATGMSKARYRITADRVWIESGVLGVRSEQVPLWSVRDIDVRQSMLQRGKDIGDVVLSLDDPAYGVAQTGAMDWDGIPNEPGTTSGEVLLDNVEGPYEVRDLLLPLVSAARSKKMMERQSQYLHVNPAVGLMGQAMAGGVPAAPAATPAPAPAASSADLPERLRALATLRDEGILTEEEFAAQKARLLSG